MADPTYRSSGAWGAGKGSALTVAELDANFFALVERIEDLETGATGTGGAGVIANITATDTTMTIVLGNATEFGPFTLPTAAFDFRGDWTATTAYVENDVVTYGNYGTFLCLQNHTSGSSFNPYDGSGNWAAMSDLSKFADKVTTFVYDSTLTSPPAAIEGDAYIVGPSPSGAWTGHADDVAVYRFGAWNFITPTDGWILWDDSAGTTKIFKYGSWEVFDPNPGTGTFDLMEISSPIASADATTPCQVGGQILADNGTGVCYSRVSGGSGNNVGFQIENSRSGRFRVYRDLNGYIKFETSTDGSSWSEFARCDTPGVMRVGNNYTVATLPALGGYVGERAFVTDANSTTFGSVVAGGGSNKVPVYNDGTNWRIG